MQMTLIEKIMMVDMKENEMEPFIMELIKKFPDKFSFDAEFVETFFGNKEFDGGADKVKKYFMKKLGIIDVKSPYYFILEKMISKQNWTEISQGLIMGFSCLFNDNENKIRKDIESFLTNKKLEISYTQYYIKEWGVKINYDIPGYIIQNVYDVYALMSNAFNDNSLKIENANVFMEKFNKISGKQIFKK